MVLNLGQVEANTRIYIARCGERWHDDARAKVRVIKTSVGLVENSQLLQNGGACQLSSVPIVQDVEYDRNRQLRT